MDTQSILRFADEMQKLVVSSVMLAEQAGEARASGATKKQIAMELIATQAMSGMSGDASIGAKVSEILNQDKQGNKFKQIMAYAQGISAMIEANIQILNALGLLNKKSKAASPTLASRETPPTANVARPGEANTKLNAGFMEKQTAQALVEGSASPSVARKDLKAIEENTRGTRVTREVALQEAIDKPKMDKLNLSSHDHDDAAQPSSVKDIKTASPNPNTAGISQTEIENLRSELAQTEKAYEERRKLRETNSQATKQSVNAPTSDNPERVIDTSREHSDRLIDTRTYMDQSLGGAPKIKPPVSSSGGEWAITEKALPSPKSNGENI